MPVELDSKFGHRSMAGGFLQWSHSCDSLVHFVNSSTYSKVILDGQVVSIGKLKPVMNTECPKVQPGTVVMIDETVWYVAAADGVVMISDFLDEDGQPITAQNLADQCHIIEGGQLRSITPEFAEWLEMVHRQPVAAQIHWSKLLGKFEASLVQTDATQPPAWAVTDFRQYSKDLTAMEIVVAWLIHLARDTEISHIQIGWDAKEYLRDGNNETPICTLAMTVLFDVFINMNDTFAVVLTSVEKCYERLINQLLNLPGTLDYHDVNNLFGKKSCVLAVSLIDTKSEHEFRTVDTNDIDSNVFARVLTLQINKQDGAFRWIYDANQISDEELERISSCLLGLIVSAKQCENAEEPVGKLDSLPKFKCEFGGSTDEHTRFFTEMLGDIDEPTLPFDLSDVDHDGDGINDAYLKLPQTLYDQLREHARNLQVSLASLCHVAWAQVLAKASGREAVVFGTVLFGRLKAENGNNSTLGPMINTLPIRLDIDERSVELVVRHTHSLLSELLAHEHAPLALAQRCSDIPAGLPLFSALLNYVHDQQIDELNWSHHGVSVIDFVERTNYPINLSIEDNGHSLSMTLQAISPISPTRVCTYMQQSLESLVDALAHAPHQPIRNLGVMPSNERTLVLHSWNQTTINHSPVCCLHQLFEAQVDCNGQAIAVECDGRTMSHAELNMQANRLSYYLIARGVKPDDRIALCIGRSTAMIVSILGILKAGCAYVPLDPVYSSERLTNILSDSNPMYLLADATGRNALGDHQIPVIDVENPPPANSPFENPDTTKLGLTPTHLAYIIYTSGSTGTPKGVMVEHQQVTRLFTATQEKLSFNREDKWCLYHSVSFDFSVWEIWGPLLHGSQLSIVSNDIIRSTDEFYDLICITGITVLNQTPSAFKMLFRVINSCSKFNELRYIILAGEWLDPLNAKDWYVKYENSGTKLFNMYGPTEATVYTTIQRLDTPEHIYSLGRPLRDLCVYLLDSNGEPVLLGVKGEIYVGGAGITRGYLNRPELSMERFSSDPFSGIPTTRMYRTGDLARYLADGDLVFLGRADHQVKIRGFRIELGEIEARLVEHDQVEEAIVQPFGDASDTRLVAYIVATTDESLAQSLRSYLSNLLPNYMIPAAYVCLPRLPLTPSGKLDRRALPAPDDAAFPHQQYEAPCGEIEEKLAGIWRELLSIDRISRHDNFFALGGHSLLIVQLLTQLRQIGLGTSVQKVYDAGNLAMLASTLTRYKALALPPNLITKETTEITPELLTLINLSQADIDAIVAQVPGGVANIQDIYGLAPLQNGMLYHHLMAKKGDPYLLVSRLSFIDRTSLERYADAMQQIIERHDIFRSAIFWDGLSEPAQVVLRKVPSLLTNITDNMNVSDQSVLVQLSQKFDPRRYRLNLTHAPLVRLMAAPTSEGNWVAVQLMHHLTIDHSTEERLQAELSVIMDGKIEMLTTPVPFRDFVAHARLSSSTNEHTRFFTEMLGDIDEPTLPFGLSDVDQDGDDTNEAYLKLPQTLCDRLRLHVRNLQVSLASLCHIAWAQLLSMASRREAVVFGTVLFGRLEAGDGNNSTLGPMINTLPIRLDIDERSVESVVRHTHSLLSELLAHEHAPLALAQRCSDIPAGLPLFSALLNYLHDQKTDELSWSHHGVSVIDFVERTNYPVVLSIEDNGLSLIMMPQAISPISPTRICTYMQQTLESLVDALTRTPLQPIQNLRVMPLDEQSLLLHSWNQTTINHSPVCCLHQLFEALVDCNGQAIAVECDGRTLSYSELNMQANRLSHYLIAEGVKPDDRIALCVDRSTAIIVAILGILKAGCAYVPLDPVYSSERLTNILSDSNPMYLLADATGRNALGDHQIPVIDVENPPPANSPFENPDTTKLGLTPTHLAYIIYTSGSTGTPKGVMVEHQQVTRLFTATQEKLSFNREDKSCLYHSVSFDFSVWEIWGPLLHGSQLSIVSNDIIRSTDEFYDWICSRCITVLNQTPSAFKMLVRVINNCSKFNELRYIILAGEWLDPLNAKDWYAKYENSGTKLFNMYGPTEATVYTTIQRFDTPENIYSLGRPLRDLCVYLLDSNGEPVLLGVKGEIYVGGAGITRGYLNRPELSMERFLPDPFSGIPTTRMYRTGDLARYLPGGDLVFLGRADHQVKIRGFRIELGEIEARIVEHPNVHDVTVQCNGNGLDMRLIAYVVTDKDTFVVQNIRTYLSNLLPDYMVPAAYVCLQSFPLTPSGKLDRRALPAPDNESFARQQYEAPQGEIEHKVATLWREILNIDRISRHDNFFALGGHSLLVVKLLARLRQVGLDTSVREVFDAPSLAILTTTLRSYKAVTVPPNLITKNSTEITPEMLPLITLSKADIDAIVAQVPGGVANIQDIYGLTPLQHGMLYHHLMAKEGDLYLLLKRLRFIDRTSLERYANAMQQILKRHDILRTAFFWDGLSEPAQVVLRQVPSLLSEITLAESDMPVLERLSHEFHPRFYRLDLAHAPLVRLMAAPEPDGSWVAVQLMHHLTIDHSTEESLQAELRAIMDGKIEMLITPNPFHDFVAHARLGINLAEHTRFFTEMLGDIDEPTLPFGLSDVDHDGDTINEAYVKLPQTLNDELREHARNLQISLASICHLAWAQLLAKASGRETVVFGTVLLGRSQTEAGNNIIMGPMINTLPIRLDIDERSVESAVRETHSRLSTLLVHEHASLVTAQRCSGIPTGTPLFSALLNYRHNQKIDVINTGLPGVNVVDENEATNYPLAISVEDDGSSLGLTVQVVPPISAQRICAYIRQSLESLANALTHTPNQSILKLTVMPPEERKLLLHSWNQTTANRSRVCCLHQLFEAQVELDGQAISLEYEGHTLSYSELNAKANRLAHYLIAEGCKIGNRIALCVERSTAMIVAILGILKAGCAYVPLDPVYPSQRLISILQDSNPTYLITDSCGSKVLGNYQVPTIELGKPLTSDTPIDNLDVTKIGLTPAQLAYIIYTSGSTGIPKGVMIEHRPVVQFFQDIGNTFDLNKEDKSCLFHSISFDISVWEIWNAFCYGSALSIVTHNMTHSTDEFYDWICTNGITVLTQTSSALKMLIRTKSNSSGSDRLRYIFFGAESSDRLAIGDWLQTNGNEQTMFIHMYGPTEALMVATSWVCDFKNSSIIPIGRSLQNRRIYLLDLYGEPVLVGAVGAIYIGGDELACGYLKRPDLTVERFLPDPFSEIPRARMYQTGDLARYLPDGNLVFMGRADQQVKIRGFRIETGEIEAHLVEHPQVFEAVIQICGDAPDARLVAYVVANTDESLAQNLRSYLSNLLPDYMVPAAYVCLPSLPLTPNGKLDRRALPVPDDEAFARQQYEAPRGEIEEKVADIWRELLGIDRISRHDNFFALGGHSLLVVRLLARLRQIGLDTTAREVFNTSTLAVLASMLTRYRSINIPPNLITKDCTEITPDMLPLINLSQADIDAIIAQTLGGVANIQDIYGLTPLQDGMLYHHLMAKEGDPYLISSTLRFINRTSLERYADTMQMVIERHDILRTAILWDGLSEPAQAVFRQTPSLLSEITLAESDKPVLERLNHEFNPRHYKLNLTQAPLLRLMAAPEPEGNWIAVQLQHHSIVDNLTQKGLKAEILAIMDGKSGMLTTPIPFRDFVAQIRLGSSSDEHRRFFTEMLGDIDEPTLPFSLKDVDQDGVDISKAYLNLPQALHDQLRLHARHSQVSLASICHLAFAHMLSAASGREAVVFGTVLLGRLQNGDRNHKIMGPMINTLPMRLNIDGRCTKTVVNDTHGKLSALLAYEHVSLVLAQRCSGIPAGLPLFSALLNYRHNDFNDEDDMLIPGVSSVDSAGQISYPLTLSLDDDDSSLRLCVEVLSPISAAQICSYMQQSLESLVDALAHAPHQPIRELRVMPPNERTLVVHSWNQTTINHSHVCCLHQLFEAQAKSNGQAIAVECKGHTMTYSELNIEANRLSHYLIAQGVKPDDRIALCADRSTALIISMLGILKAGCAYVPLDPAYPSQRLTNILLDSNPIYLLANETGRNALGDHQIPVIDVESPLPANLLLENPDTTKLGLTPAHLAYIIYTSGSTGTPKGVMIEHQQVVRLLEATHEKLDFYSQDRRCLCHSFSFDVSVYEIWGTFSCQSQLFIVPYNIVRSAVDFYDWLCENSVTVVNQTPSAFKMLMQAKKSSSKLDRLRYVLIGGEELDPMFVKEWFVKCEESRAMLVNMYGNTETTVHAVIQQLKNTKNSHSIGRPLSDLRVYLLDSWGAPVVLGAEGEIYISGAGVARGYLNRPELNAERFRSDPFSELPTARMYRTGDLARYLPDGNLVYLGRMDQQVKIRGFRIELGEIEARLVEHPDVREAIVQSYGNGSDARLVAYVVAVSTAALVQNLRSYLSNLLPDYMVPAAYVCLPSLPLTPSGKLDRQALPAPNDEAIARQQYEAPQGELEEKLGEIWRELLNIDRISRHDNFFALGGHSLLIVRLLAQLRQNELDTSAREVFDAPTLAILATKLAGYEALAVATNLITKETTKITPEMLPLINLSQADIDAIVAQVPGGVANIQDIYGLTPLQSGMLYHHLMTKVGDPYLLIMRLSFVDRTSLERYADAMQQIIERHDIFRTAVFWDGLSEPAQVVLRNIPSLLTDITDNMNVSDQSVLAQLSQKFDPRRYRLNLTHAPLVRLMAAPTSEGNWVAVQLMHHLTIDHSTEERLQAELHAIMDGEFDQLTTPKPFRDFVAHARLGVNLAEHTRFFTEMLSDIDEPTLPFGLSDVDRNGSEIIEAHLGLPQALNDQLRAHARNLKVSMASICHLSWAKVLANAIGQQAVVFGTVLLGRLQAKEENVSAMGPMINTLPIRLNIDERSIENAVRDTYARLSALLVHEHAALVTAQRCSGVPQNLPLFSSLLNYRHNQSTGEVDMSQHGVTIIDGEERTNYPLSLSIEDDGRSLGLTVQVVTQISVSRICAYMQQALESIAYALNYTPHQSVRKLRMMPPQERTMLLHNWNQTAFTSPLVCCLHQSFEAQVERDGEAFAVECQGHTLTYSELNIRANRLAHHLIAQGVKPDDRIALCAERSTVMIVSILGIVKSGCAYVPLDPAYPSKRLTNILLDANPVFLLADETGRHALGKHQVPVIDLEKQLSSDLPTDNPDTAKLGLTPAHLAYAIYTSGSTGMPKGVIVEHRQAVRLFCAAQDIFDFNKHDKWCLFASMSFDVSVWEIWSVFYYGSQLLIPLYKTIRAMDEFYDWICINGITVLNPTPSAFKMLIRVENFSLRSDRLRFVLIGGESLDPMIVMEWYEKNQTGKTTLFNMYGNTETAVQAVIQRLETTENIYTIGRPLPDLCVYLIDSYGEPVLLGAEGEVYIGGAGVARGYLNRFELTAERFLTDSFSVNPAARMYRTGDRGRYLSNGNLVFLGRIDQQVKIRGFRIEPGEIEAHLIEHPQVSEAVVQPYGDASDARLVAYVVAHTDESLAQNLRTYLSNLLPEYMIPAAYVCLPSLPLSTSGKLDRRALPTPDDKAFARQQYEAPKGEMEEKLTNIWRELLNIERISRHDNFFALGGHSLLVVKMMAQLRHLSLNTTARDVFDAPTLAKLASTLSRYKAENVPANLIRKNCTEITPEMLPLINLSKADIEAIIAQTPGGVANIQDIYGLTPLQHGMLYHYLIAKEGDPHLTVNWLSFINRALLECYADAMQMVIERHDILRTAFFWDGSTEPAQVVWRQVPKLLTEITLNMSNKPVLEQLSPEFHPHRYHLDLARAPLLRLMAAPASDGSWVAVQPIHHSIYDNLTLKLLQAEISAIMDGKIEKLTTPVPFRGFVAQARLCSSPDEHRRFFTEMLGDVVDPTLPFGLCDVDEDDDDVNEAFLSLPETLSDQLRQHARNLQVSLASICHLAWAQVLAKASGREAVVFGTVVLGRLQAGEGNIDIMGPTINTLPIRLNVGDGSAESSVRETHTRLSALLAHEHASLVLAQRCSGVPAGSPLFNSLLNYRHNQKPVDGEENALHPGISNLDSFARAYYPIMLSVDDDDSSLFLSIAIMPPISAQRIYAYMQQALESLVVALTHTPEQPIRTLTVMPSDEQNMLLHDWNQTAVDFSPVCCVHQLFEEQVDCDGQAIAVECNGQTMSYSELNIQANRLSHYLIAQGVKPDDRIALCVGRSTPMIAAILGILKAGCAYVPLHSVYSSQRLTNILLDVKPIFLLTDSTVANVFGDHQIPLIKLDMPLPSDLPVENSDIAKIGLTPAHLAYIIYTPVSTGTPNGVMVEHQAVVRSLKDVRNKFDFNKGDAWCLFHSVSFDISIWEIWNAFYNGSQLSIVPYEIAGSADDLYNWICSNHINVLTQTPSAFTLLLCARNIRLRPNELRYIIFEGEALDPMIIRTWCEKYNECGTIFVNVYGPTETILVATSWICDFEVSKATISPVGRPLSNKRIYLLDAYGEPVLLGAEGEIYIGGASFAREYLNRPELTAQRFLPDPFSKLLGAQMYRTGDRGRFLPDGNLVFLGRVGPQVNICGTHHYEAPHGEIEEKLAQIWRELLNIDRVSRHDNFFELGGHSLLALHFVNKAKHHNMHIDARGIFSFPILRSLAEQITNRSNRFYCCDAAIPVRRNGIEAPLFLLPDGTGDISYAFELAQDIDKNIPVYVLPWSSPNGEQPSSIEEVAKAMIPLIKRVRANGPCAVAGYSSGGILAIEITKQLINCGYGVSLLGLIDTYAPITMNPLSETEWFLRQKLPFSETLKGAIWWDRVSKCTLNEANEEIHKTNMESNDIDVEREALLSKQRFNYRNICAAYKIESIPIKIHLFEAKSVDKYLDIMHENSMDGESEERASTCTTLGWECYNLSTEIITMLVDGNHKTIITNPKNRCLLGKLFTQHLLQQKH